MLIRSNAIAAPARKFAQYTQICLRGKLANWFAMTSLGDRVRAFRTHPSRQWSAADLARRVGTSRQNIENLEAGAVGSPRYLAALAAVMGTTTDDLLGRASAVKHVAMEPPPAFGAPSLETTLRTLGQHLQGVDPALRPALAANLRQWALDGGPDHYVPAVLLLFHSGPQSKQRAV